ncbi:uncharacterized protein G2W53_043136 [Senna tora]|uniref:Uncharacterized protein n=1 Tax=Senna tora TaxID=362788 RepID=A0A834SGI9_9FABA|nr:uncharacterized protein G2W53_043136 [Senna tora]
MAELNVEVEDLNRTQPTVGRNKKYACPGEYSYLGSVMSTFKYNLGISN